jgi:translation initiation factor IF-2
LQEFGTDKAIKEQSKATVQLRQERETISLVPAAPVKEAPKKKEEEPVQVAPPVVALPPAPVVPVATEPEVIKAKAERSKGRRPWARSIWMLRRRVPRRQRRPPATAPAEVPAVEVPAAPVAAPEVVVPEVPAEPETIRVNVQKLAGVKTLGKIELPVEKERKPTERESAADRGRRKRIVKPGPVNVERTVQQEQRAPAPTGPPR